MHSLRVRGWAARRVAEKIAVRLEIRDPGDIDDQVVGWLGEAADRAS